MDPDMVFRLAKYQSPWQFLGIAQGLLCAVSNRQQQSACGHSGLKAKSPVIQIYDNRALVWDCFFITTSYQIILFSYFPFPKLKPFEIAHENQCVCKHIMQKNAPNTKEKTQSRALFAFLGMLKSLENVEEEKNTGYYLKGCYHIIFFIPWDSRRN